MNWTLQPIALSAANALVLAEHRHAGPVVGHLFSIGLFSPDWELLGAAITGRPVARALDDGTTVEVTRLVTIGVPNACSALYGSACREARRRGYRKVVTYTRADETGASLRASNFSPVAHVKGQQWDRPSRKRSARPTVDRVRWERCI